MLTAKTKDGKKLSLSYHYKKETLLSLRKREEFFCQICGEKVYLKLGDKKIYHFAHQRGSSCREFYENETEGHMEGKLQLFQWLKRQKILAELEYFDREIQQRPDIFFVYQEKKYALEYQCSTISEQMFQKRTEGYLSHGYIPLWILGCKHFHNSFEHSHVFTSFMYLFLRQGKNGRLFLPSYSPETSTFQILYSIFPYSPKNAFIQKKNQPIEKLRLPLLLEHQPFEHLNIGQWKTALEKYKMKWLSFPSVPQQSFLNEIYNSGLNLFLFPPEIGLPVSRGILIQNPPFIWQAYYYLDVLKNKFPGDFVSIHEIERSLAVRITKKDLQIRSIPQANNLKPILAFVDYTRLLINLGVLNQKAEGIYQIGRLLEIPKTNREREEKVDKFYKKNHEILFTINETE